MKSFNNVNPVNHETFYLELMILLRQTSIKKTMSTQKSLDRHTPLPLPGNLVKAPEQRYFCRDLYFD